MTLRHLRIFVEVVNCGKMSDAAAKLYISQSSISQTIAELEGHYNVKLFDRLSKRLFLTAAGRELYEMASKVILSYDEMDHYMTSAAGNQEFKAGATFTVGATVMTQILKRLANECPDITARVVVDRTPLLERMLLHGELDAAVVEGIVKSKDLVVQKLMEDELFLVCNGDHPFAWRNEIGIEELEGQDFIMREPQSRTRRIFEGFLEDGHVSVAEKWTCNNPETIKSAVIAGYGLSVLSKRYVMDEIASGAIMALRVGGVRMVRDFSLVYHKSKYHFPAFIKFIEICRSFGGD